MSLKKYFTAALGAGLLLNAAFSSAASEKPNILLSWVMTSVSITSVPTTRA